MQVLELTARHAVTTSSRLPFDDSTFDCAVSAFGAIHARDPRRLTAELNRVVRPEGRLGIAAWAPTGFMGRALVLAADVLGRKQARAAARWGRYEDAYRRFGFQPGFDLREEELVMEFADAEDALATVLEAPGPLFTEGDERAALEPELLRLIEEHRTPDGEGCAVRCEYVLILARTPLG
jgi:SAM-dependent methyltransferase